MKVALCQLEIIWENKEQSFNKCYKFVNEAMEQQADIIFFPEMSLTGFSMNIDKTKEEKNESIEFFSACALEHKIAIGFGWVCSKGDKAQNHYTIISNTGEILVDYIKIHPFSYAGEDKYFLAGNKIGQCNYKGFNIGVSICFDLRFPEIYQIMSRDSQLIIVPANWPEARREHWNSLLRARAIENQVYIIGINCVGEIGGIKYSGDSQIINPNGEILTVNEYLEGLTISNLENDVNQYRNKFPIKSSRRDLLYEQLRVNSYER